MIEPYSRWDTAKLGAYLRSAGKDAQQGAKDTKDGLLSKVKSSWYETEESAQQAWGNAKEWILDTWTESQLKAFCDKHGIPGTSSVYYTIYLRARIRDHSCTILTMWMPSPSTTSS